MERRLPATAGVRTARPLSRRAGRAGPSGRDAEPALFFSAGAKSALDRIVIPQDALDRIAAIAPRSSLIVTDEALSSETGKGLFVVLLSGRAAGRHQEPAPRDRRPNSVMRAHAIGDRHSAAQLSTW